MQLFPAFHAAAAFKLLSAVGALNEEQVTAFIPAVGMIVGRGAALVAAGDHVAGNPLAEALIEDEILADEFQRQMLLARAARIFDDASLELEDIPKTVMKQVCAGLFAPDAA